MPLPDSSDTDPISSCVQCKIPHVSMDVFTLQEVAHAPTPQPALKGYAAKDGYAADGVSGVAVGIPSCDSSVSGGGMDASGTNKRAMYMDPNVIDPFKLMEPQLRALSESIKLLVQSDNPVLHK